MTIAVALLATAMVIVLSRSARGRSDSMTVRVSRPERQDALRPVETDVSARMEIVEAEPRSAGDKTLGIPDATRPQALKIHGEILESDGLGLSGVDVLFRGRYDSADSRRAVTGPDGRFELRLDPEEWNYGVLANVHVSTASGMRLFTGVVPLEPSVSILLATPVYLKGRLSGAEDIKPGPIGMRFDVPAGERFGSNLFIGKTQVAADGRFSLVARLPTTTSLVLMTFFNDTTPLGNAAADLAQLTSTNGAVVDLDVGQVTLRYVDVERRPLEDVRISACPPGRPYSLSVVSLVTDSDGVVELTVPRGSVEVCAYRDGYIARTDVVEVRASERAEPIEIVLSQRDSHPIVTGTVLRPDGRPLPGAAVSIFPETDTDAGFYARSKIATDDQGRFALPLHGDGPHRVLTVHRVLGRGPSLIVQAHTQDVTIWFEQRGGVVLEVVAAPSALHTVAGPLECVLVDRDRKFVIREHVWGTPTPLDGIPVGRYNLFVHWPGMDVSGAASVTVEAGVNRTCRVVLEPVRRLHGSVVDAAGAPVTGATVLRLDGREFLGASHPWAIARTGPDGRFSFLLGPTGPPHHFRVTSDSAGDVDWIGASSEARIVVPGR